MKISLSHRYLSDRSKVWSVLIKNDEQTTEIECLDERHAMLLAGEIITSLEKHSIYAEIGA